MISLPFVLLGTVSPQRDPQSRIGSAICLSSGQTKAASLSLTVPLVSQRLLLLSGVTKSSRMRYAADEPASTSTSRMSNAAFLFSGLDLMR